MIQLPKDNAAIDVFWDEHLESYVLTLRKGDEWTPVRLGATSLSMLRERITEVLSE